MAPRVLAITWFVVFGVSCSMRPAYEFLSTHPDFSPISPRHEQTEYQLTWYRSPQPLVHIRVKIESHALTDVPRAFVSYSVSRSRVRKLKTVVFPAVETHELKSTLEKTGFWKDGLESKERLYRYAYYNEFDEDTKEITVTADGASMTIAASEASRSKGISIACGAQAKCEPFDQFAIALMKLVSIENVMD